MTDPIKNELTLPGSPQEVYAALTDARIFSKMSGGAPAEIDPRGGGSFSCFGGMIEGRNIECLPGERLVQAWRAKNWPPGVYSLARFELRASPEAGSTELTFEHVGFPPAEREHLAAGWEANYWAPLRARGQRGNDGGATRSPRRER